MGDLTVFFSHNSDEWGTPQDFFDILNNEFHFDIDVCASEKNHKCKCYFDKETNGLEQNWGGVIFCNPPYSQVALWAKKCYEESLRGVICVMLVPARTDTKWFHNYVYGKAELRFIKGRLRFIPDGRTKAAASPFPSVVCIYRNSLND